MGGALVIGVVATLALVVLALLPEAQRGDYVAQTIAPLGALLAVGLLGAVDDWVNVVSGTGIRGRQKLLWQLVVAVIGAVYIQRHFGVTGIYVPLVGEWEIGAVAFVLIAVFMIVGFER